MIRSKRILGMLTASVFTFGLMFANISMTASAAANAVNITGIRVNLSNGVALPATETSATSNAYTVYLTGQADKTQIVSIGGTIDTAATIKVNNGAADKSVHVNAGSQVIAVPSAFSSAFDGSNGTKAKAGISIAALKRTFNGSSYFTVSVYFSGSPSLTGGANPGGAAKVIKAAPTKKTTPAKKTTKTKKHKTTTKKHKTTNNIKCSFL
jgi:hypothetical protein